MANGNGSDEDHEVVDLPGARRARTRRTDAHGVRGLAEKVTESVWTRALGRGAMMACAGLLSLNLWFAQDKVDEFKGQFQDLRAEQAKINDKIDALADTQSDKMATVIANQAAGLADRNAQAGQIADLKDAIKDMKADFMRQADALSQRLTNLGSKLFDMKGNGGH